MQFIVIGTLFVMFGTFWAIAVEQRAFKLGTKLALLGIVLCIVGSRSYAADHGAKKCEPIPKDQTFIPAICRVKY